MNLRSLRALLAVVLMVGVMTIVGCEANVDQSSFDQIQSGMTMPEVEKIMGGKGTMEEVKGTSISAAGIGGSNSSANIYKWEKGSRLITVTVKDGKVLDKGKSGF